MNDEILNEIENAESQRSSGVVGYRIYEGARREGASRLDAMFVLAAWWFAMLHSNDDMPAE